MTDRSPRWATGALLLMGIVAIGLARGGQAGPLAVQDVHVTNTAAQQVPVLPAARPSASGAYIVAVANSPTVKTLGGPTNAFQLYGTNAIADGYVQAASGAYTVPAGKRLVIEAVNTESGSVVNGAYATYTYVTISGTGGEKVRYYFALLPTSGFATLAIGNVSTGLVADAGDSVDLVFGRGTNSGSAAISYALTGHLVNYP